MSVGKGQARRFHYLQAPGDFGASSRTFPPGYACVPYGIGTVLPYKDIHGREHPSAFPSRSLLKSEQNYSQIDKEALVLAFGIGRFHQHLRGIPFEAHTDQKPLLGLLGVNKPVPVQA